MMLSTMRPPPIASPVVARLLLRPSTGCTTPFGAAVIGGLFGSTCAVRTGAGVVVGGAVVTGVVVGCWFPNASTGAPVPVETGVVGGGAVVTGTTGGGAAAPGFG